MATPLVAPSPFGRSSEFIAQNDGLLRNLAAQTAALGAAQAADQKAKADIATTMLSNADDLASVFGGMQTGAGIENYVNLPSLRGLNDTGLQGSMTGQLDAMRLAMLANRARGGGRGGDKSGSLDKLVNVEWTDPEGNKHVMPMSWSDATKIVDIDNEDFRTKYGVRILGPAGDRGTTTVPGLDPNGDVDLKNMSDEDLQRIINGG